MARRGSYKFTSKKQSGKGLVAVILGIASISTFIVTVVESFSQKGNGSVYLGSAGLTALFVALAGICLAGSSFKGDRTFKMFSWIGMILSVIAFVVWLLVYGAGFLL